MLIPLLYQDIHLLDQDIHLFIPNWFWPFVPHMSHTKTSSGFTALLLGALWALPSYWAALWRPMSSALLLGGPLAQFGRCPPIGRPFDAILALPNHRAGLEAPFGACADALAQKCAKFTSQPTNIHSSEFVLGFHRGNTSPKEPYRS